MTEEPKATAEPQPAELPAPSTDVSRIDQGFKMSRVEGVEVEPGRGVVSWSLPEMIEAAKLMARADIALPPHARNKPEVCFAIMMQADSWHLRNPFFVASHSYVVEQKANIDGQWQTVKTLAYDSAVFQAALMASRAIIGRPQYDYEGEGQERTCTVRVQVPGGGWEEAKTPPLKVCHPGHITKDGKQFVKGSPLWDRNADQQQAYFGLRNLVRLKFQDVLGGFYDKDEFDEFPELGAVTDITPSTPNLLQRLPGRTAGDGFQPDTVELAAEEQAALAKAEAAKEAKRAQKAPRRTSVGGRRARQKVKGAATLLPEAKTAPEAPEA